MALYFEPAKFSDWVKKVDDKISGGDGSIAYCSKKFSELIEELVEPEVWTGSAAKANYNNFIETQRSLIKFANAFGEAFTAQMTNVRKNIGELEQGLLGSRNYAGTFPNLDFKRLEPLSEQNINTGVITYNYNKINSISVDLKTIYSKLNDAFKAIGSYIGRLNQGNKEFWEGNAAQGAKESLKRVLEENKIKINKNLETCIKNINTAAAEAKKADTKVVS